MAGIWCVKNLSRPRRTALGAIRAAKALVQAPGRPSDEEGKAFVELVGNTAVRLMEIYAAESAFASIDELRLIDAIAAIQRGHQLDPIGEPILLLRRCAACLTAKGCILPFTDAARVRLAEWGWLHAAPPAKPAVPSPSARAIAPRPGTAAAKAVELLQLHKLVRTGAFRAIGIGRAQLGKICAAGHIRRLTHGIYALPAGETGDPISDRAVMKSIRGKQAAAPLLEGVATDTPQSVFWASQHPAIDSLSEQGVLSAQGTSQSVTVSRRG